MDHDEIKRHWESWSRAGTDLRATTKTPTIKALEIDAIIRAIDHHLSPQPEVKLLEAGCGNGHNIVALAKAFPDLWVHGFDYVDDMAVAARKMLDQAGISQRACIFNGSVLAIDEIDGLASAYDVVLSDRLIINLNSEELQWRALLALAGRTKPGGLLLVLENFVESFERQNDGREMVGLPRRKPAEFNRFIGASRMEAMLKQHRLSLLDVDEFGSLHDLLLYVLLPALNGGKVDYDHPLVSLSAEFSAKAHARESNAFGAWGQNRLYVLRKQN